MNSKTKKSKGAYLSSVNCLSRAEVVKEQKFGVLIYLIGVVLRNTTLMRPGSGRWKPTTIHRLLNHHDPKERLKSTLRILCRHMTENFPRHRHLLASFCAARNRSTTFIWSFACHCIPWKPHVYHWFTGKKVPEGLAKDLWFTPRSSPSDTCIPLTGIHVG